MTHGVLKKLVFGNEGLAFLTISESDLGRVKDIITWHYKERLTHILPKDDRELLSLPIDRYHEKSERIDHKKAWPKKERMLSRELSQAFSDLEFFAVLHREFENFIITDEEGLGYPNIYWRLVRPNNPEDVGSIHADEWFWKLNNAETPQGVKRVKVWLAVYCESGRNGLQFIRGSHNRDWPYHAINKSGAIKPELSCSLDGNNMELFLSRPGDAIVFNDKLLHGGLVGGALTRVSIEFTMFVPET